MPRSKNVAPNTSTNNVIRPRFRPGWTDKKTGKRKSGFWYFWDGKRRVNLGINEDEPSDDGRDRAVVALADRLRQTASEEKNATDPTLRVLFDAYLANLKRRIERNEASRLSWANAARFSFDFLTGCSPKMKKGDVVGHGERIHDGYGELRISELRQFHIRDWCNAHRGWRYTKRPIGVVQAALNEAVNMGLIHVNPVRGYKTSASPPRTIVWDDAEIAMVRGLAETNKRFQSFVRFFNGMLATGARPGELAIVTAKHFRRSKKGRPMLVLAPHEWKNGRKTGKPRKIPLNPELEAVVLAAIERGDDGPLFKTARGRRWTYSGWTASYKAVRRKLQKLYPSFRSSLRLYDLRATFITNRIDAGANIQGLADGCGTSTGEIGRTYLRETVQTDERTFEAVAAVQTLRLAEVG